MVRSSNKQMRKPISKVVKKPIRKASKSGIKRQKKKGYDWHWSLTFLILSWFLGMPVIFYHASTETLISFSVILMIVLGSGVLSLLIQTPLFVKLRQRDGGEKFIVGKQLFVIYNIFGVGVFACALMLQLNYSFRNKVQIVEEYEIIKVDPNFVPGAYSGIVFVLEGGQYEDNVDARWFEVIAKARKRDRPFVRYVSYEGLFGFTILSDRFLVSGPNDNAPLEQPFL